MATLNFNATGKEPAQISKPNLPVSDKTGHLVVITDSGIIENKAKTGGYVEYELTIIEGPLKGEQGAYRLNLFNPSEQAVRIAEGQQTALCLVTGVIDVKDTQQLHNIPFRAVVGLQKGENPEGYTEVKGVLHANGAAPGKSTGAPPAGSPTPTPPPATNAPAWTPPGTATDTPPPASSKPAWGGAPAEGSPTPPWSQPK